MILTTNKPKTNKERVQEWRERNFKQKQEAVKSVKEKLSWFEPVEQ